MRLFEIFVTALIAALLLLVEHYLPWRGIFRKDLHPTLNYVLGTLALNLPITGLLIVWQLWWVIAGVWATTVFGGLAVIGAYGLDSWVAQRNQLHVASQEAQTLRPEVKDDAWPETI